jgi:hypothetical protein
MYLKPGLKKLTVAAIILTAVIILVTLSIIFGRKQNHFKCDIKFERNLEFESKLGNYSKFAVAADNFICSTIGK